MKRIIRLTESDLTRIVRRVLNEDVQSFDIVQLNKEDIKSIRFLDNRKRDIIKDYTVQGPNTTGANIKVNLKPVNFSEGEVCNFRLLLSKKISVNSASSAKNVSYRIGDSRPRKLDVPSFDLSKHSDGGTIVSVMLPLNYIAGDVTSFQITIPTFNTEYGEITVDILINKASWQIDS